MTEINKPSRASGPKPLESQRIARQKAQQRLAQQVASERSAKANVEDIQIRARIEKQNKTLEERRLKKAISKSQFTEDIEEAIEEVTTTEETASRFQKRNFELKSKTLVILRDSISDEDSVEDILRKVLNFYPDYTLADEALDFLLDTTSGKLALKVNQAKEYLNNTFKREIVAGKNIKLHAQTFSKEGLGSPSALRDMYRDITGNQRTPIVLFDELNAKFSYDSMRIVIRFLLHSLGSDLKSKGPSITRPELIRLMEDTQMLQSILGVFRFFKDRGPLINSQFDHFGLILTKNMHFENLSKIFINFLKERYVSSDKIILLSTHLGIINETIAQIIIYTQMKDALRNTSLKLYRSEKHRQELQSAFLEALEELEEEIEEEE